jgi:hypothetical protein
MVYLLQMPFARETFNYGFAPRVVLLSQKHINPYPHLVASALLTHVAYEDGGSSMQNIPKANRPALQDYIISFSGCKIYSSQDVCNALFFNYFAQSVEDYDKIQDEDLELWLEKGVGPGGIAAMKRERQMKNAQAGGRAEL